MQIMNEKRASISCVPSQSRHHRTGTYISPGDLKSASPSEIGTRAFDVIDIYESEPQSEQLTDTPITNENIGPYAVYEPYEPLPYEPLPVPLHPYGLPTTIPITPPMTPLSNGSTASLQCSTDASNITVPPIYTPPRPQIISPAFQDIIKKPATCTNSCLTSPKRENPHAHSALPLVDRVLQNKINEHCHYINPTSQKLSFNSSNDPCKNKALPKCVEAHLNKLKPTMKDDDALLKDLLMNPNDSKKYPKKENRESKNDLFVKEIINEQKLNPCNEIASGVQGNDLSSCGARCNSSTGKEIKSTEKSPDFIECDEQMQPANNRNPRNNTQVFPLKKHSIEECYPESITTSSEKRRSSLFKKQKMPKIDEIVTNRNATATLLNTSSDETKPRKKEPSPVKRASRTLDSQFEQHISSHSSMISSGKKTNTPANTPNSYRASISSQTMTNNVVDTTAIDPNENLTPPQKSAVKKVPDNPIYFPATQSHHNHQSRYQKPPANHHHQAQSRQHDSDSAVYSFGCKGRHRSNDTNPRGNHSSSKYNIINIPIVKEPTLPTLKTCASQVNRLFFLSIIV